MNMHTAESPYSEHGFNYWGEIEGHVDTRKPECSAGCIILPENDFDALNEIYEYTLRHYHSWYHGHAFMERVIMAMTHCDTEADMTDAVSDYNSRHPRSGGPQSKITL